MTHGAQKYVRPLSKGIHIQGNILPLFLDEEARLFQEKI